MKEFKFYEAMLNEKRREVFFDGIDAIEKWVDKVTVGLLAATSGIMILTFGERQLPFQMFAIASFITAVTICFAMTAVRDKILAPVHLFEVAGYQSPNEVSYDANRLLTTVAYHYMEDAHLFLEKNNKLLAFLECYKHAKQQAKAAKVLYEKIENVYEVSYALSQKRKAFVKNLK